jgi:hypothetical protein
LRQTPRHRQQLRNLIIVQDDRHFYASVAFLAQFKRHSLGEGERFSHNPKKRTSYGRRPKSAARGFMVVFFDIVDRAAQQTSLSTANRPSTPIFASNQRADSIAYSRIPYAKEQGNSKRVSGNFFQGTGNFPPADRLGQIACVRWSQRTREQSQRAKHIVCR